MPKTRKERMRKGGSSNHAKNKIFAVIHATWCGHCTQLMPHWKEMEKQMKGKYNIQRIDIDGAKIEDEIAKLNKHIIDDNNKIDKDALGFPTILSIIDGNLSNYTGARDTESLIAWVESSNSQPYLVAPLHPVKGDKNQMGGKKGRHTQKRRVKKSSSFKFW